MFLELLKENKYQIFIKPAIMKDLISCAKGTYGLSKQELLQHLKGILNVICNNNEYPTEFCFKVLVEELDRYMY